MRQRLPALSLLCLLSPACAWTLPSQTRLEPAYIILVKTVRIPESKPWISRFADHSYFDMKLGAEDKWKRLEVSSYGSGRRYYDISAEAARGDERWGRPVKILRKIEGDNARKIIEDAVKNSEGWAYDEEYRAWPGPNSNSFAAMVLRTTGGLSVELDHNASGKDYTAFIALRGTTTGTGFQVDTVPIGFSVGIMEGIELHFLQFTFGISLIPPAIKIPILPRLGF